MKEAEFVRGETEFAIVRKLVGECFSESTHLPEQVFSPEFVDFSFEEFDWAMSSDFAKSINILCSSSGDDSCFMLVTDPDPVDYFKREFDWFGCLDVPAKIKGDEYWSLLSDHPWGEAADSMLANSEKLVWVPRSRSWAIWGARESGLVVLAKRNKHGISWNDASWALNSVLPNSFRTRIVPAEFKEKLLRNFVCA